MKRIQQTAQYGNDWNGPFACFAGGTAPVGAPVGDTPFTWAVARAVAAFAARALQLAACAAFAAASLACAAASVARAAASWVRARSVASSSR